MRINLNTSINQSRPNFKAKLQLEGNRNLLKNNQIEKLRDILYKVGDNGDTVLVELPSHSNSSGTIWMSRFRISNIDYNCLGVKAYYDNNDVFGGIINGLNKMNFSEQIINSNTEYALPKYDVEPKFQEEIVESTSQIVEKVNEDMSIKGPNLGDIYPRVSSWKQQLLEDYFHGRYGIEDLD